MDKATLHILSLVIGGTGLFVVVTKFNVPELRMSFLGENPFAIKREVIDNVMSWIVASLTLVGLLIQACTEIWGHELPERLHATLFYVSLFITAVIATIIFVVLLTAVGRSIARRHWQPSIIEKLREGYNQARIIVAQEGWRQSDRR